MEQQTSNRDSTYYNELALRAKFDIDAFNELYDYFFPRVYNFLFAQVKNSSITDDIISEVFIKAFKNLSAYNPQKAAFSTWLFRIAINQKTDYFRQEQRRQENSWEEFFNPPIPQQEEPEAQLLIAEGKQELFQAMDKLKTRDKYILELKYWSNLSNKEIADILELSPANVGIILFRAIGTLKKIITKV